MFADMEPARITGTNLNVSQDLEVKLGETLTIFCRSQGNPEPKTHWLKVSSADVWINMFQSITKEFTQIIKKQINNVLMTWQ
jgi:hypothetical protein